MPLTFLVVMQLFFIGCAEILAAWIQMPLATLIGIGTTGLAGILGTFAEATGRWALGKYAKVVAAASLILLPASLVVPRIEVKTLDNYYAVVAWLLAAFRVNFFERRWNPTRLLNRPRTSEELVRCVLAAKQGRSRVV